MSECKLCQCGFRTDAGTLSVCPMHRTQAAAGPDLTYHPSCTCGPWWGVVPPPPCPVHSGIGVAASPHPVANPPRCECHECTQARARIKEILGG